MHVRRAKKTRVRAAHKKRKPAGRRAISPYAVAGPDKAVDSRDNGNELEYNRKIAEARALLQANYAHDAMASPSRSDSVSSPSTTDTDIGLPSHHHFPVMSLPAFSIGTTSRELDYVNGIGIAMTENERRLLETLVSDRIKSESSELESSYDSARRPGARLGSKDGQQRIEAREVTRTYIGYVINFHNEDIKDEEQEFQIRL